jgi:hypothetical protein
LVDQVIALQEPELVIEAINNVINKASLISKKKRLAAALSNATTLIKSKKVEQAETLIFELFSDIALKADQINTLGYKYLSKKGVDYSWVND